MYEENENRINWKTILKKVLIVLAAALLIFGIIALVNKCTHKEEEKPSIKEVVDLTKQLDILEEATLKYLTKDNVPTELNASKTIRLKTLMSRGLVKNITDSKNNKCNSNESYAEVTRLDNNYAVKLSLTCGTNKDYRIIYVGCFAECTNGGICKGTESSTGGICNVAPVVEQNTDDVPVDTKNDNAATTKPSTNTKPSNTSKPSTTRPVVTKPTTNNQNTTKPKKVTMYEYKKCSVANFCPIGKEENGRCATQVRTTLQGRVIQETKAITKDVGPVRTNTFTNYNTYASFVKNISTTKPSISATSKTAYKLVGYKSGKYTFAQYTCYSGNIKNVGGVYKCGTTSTSSTCSVGTPSGGRCVTTVYEKSSKCEDSSYTYNARENTCTKEVYKTEYRDLIKYPTNCQTTWSKSTSLSGWTRTGNVKTVTE